MPSLRRVGVSDSLLLASATVYLTRLVVSFSCSSFRATVHATVAPAGPFTSCSVCALRRTPRLRSAALGGCSESPRMVDRFVSACSDSIRLRSASGNIFGGMPSERAVQSRQSRSPWQVAYGRHARGVRDWIWLLCRTSLGLRVIVVESLNQFAPGNHLRR